MAEPATPSTPRGLYGARHWPSWCLMGFGWLLAKLPYRLQMAIGRRLGDLAYRVAGSRRRVAEINLRLCFGELDAAERERLLRAHFRSAGMGAVETCMCWWGKRERIEKLVTIEGQEHLTAAAANNERGIILLSAHFTSLELGVRLAKPYLLELGRRTTAMYKPPHDPVVDHVMRSRREAHIEGASIADNDIKGLLRALRRGDAVWYATDQKPPKGQGVIVDFFDQPARTHVTINRLARVSRASVLPFFTLREDDGSGYRLIVLPAIEASLGEDAAVDAERINAMIESIVRRAPEQYFWLHQRFKYDRRNNPYRRPAAADK